MLMMPPGDTAGPPALLPGTRKRITRSRAVVAAAERHVAASDVLLDGGHIVVGKGKRDLSVLMVRANLNAHTLDPNDAPA